MKRLQKKRERKNLRRKTLRWVLNTTRAFSNPTMESNLRTLRDALRGVGSNRYVPGASESKPLAIKIIGRVLRGKMGTRTYRPLSTRG